MVKHTHNLFDLLMVSQRADLRRFFNQHIAEHEIDKRVELIGFAFDHIIGVYCEEENCDVDDVVLKMATKPMFFVEVMLWLQS